MSAISIGTSGPAFARASSAIEGERSQAVTFQPCSIIGRKLLPVPQATSSTVSPCRPCAAPSSSSMPTQRR